MKKIILAVAVAAVAIMGVAGSALAGPATGISATPAATKTWDNTFSATFVRSASGIINETAPGQLGWRSERVDAV